MLSPICIFLQIGVTAYGGVVTTIDYKKVKCIDNAENFMLNIKMTLAYLILMILVVTIYFYTVFKEHLNKYRKKLEFLRLNPNLVYESSDEVDDREVEALRIQQIRLQ